MTAVGPMSYPGVPKETRYEGLKTRYRKHCECPMRN